MGPMTDSEQISRLLHDANGSVQAIVTFLEFLEDEPLSEEVRSELEATLEKGDKLIRELRELRQLLPR
jgi:predicted transcriptional regulator